MVGIYRRTKKAFKYLPMSPDKRKQPDHTNRYALCVDADAKRYVAKTRAQ